MDFLIEFLIELIFTPIAYLFIEVPISICKDEVEASKLSKRRKRILTALIVSVFLTIIVCAIAACVLLSKNESRGQFISGIVLVSFAAALFIGYFTFVGVCLSKKRKRERKIAAEKSAASVLGKWVHVVIDRPLGSTHPEHSDIVYEVNYGYIPQYIGGDGEAQDAYVLGVDRPVTEFDGIVTAIIRRLNDVEDKWVVVPNGIELSDDEIIRRTHFQEQHFEITLLR